MSDDKTTLGEGWLTSLSTECYEFSYSCVILWWIFQTQRFEDVIYLKTGRGFFKSDANTSVSTMKNIHGLHHVDQSEVIHVCMPVCVCVFVCVCACARTRPLSKYHRCTLAATWPLNRSDAGRHEKYWHLEWRNVSPTTLDKLTHTYFMRAKNETTVQSSDWCQLHMHTV